MEAGSLGGWEGGFPQVAALIRLFTKAVSLQSCTLGVGKGACARGGECIGGRDEALYLGLT